MSSYLLWCSPYCSARQHRGVVGPVRVPLASTAVCHEEEPLADVADLLSKWYTQSLTCPRSSTTCLWNNWLLWTLNNSCLLFPYAGKALWDGWSICLWTRGSTSNICSTLDISVGSCHDINAILKYKPCLFWHTHMYVCRIIIVHGRSIRSSLISIATPFIWWCDDFACGMQAHAFHSLPTHTNTCTLFIRTG